MSVDHIWFQLHAERTKPTPFADVVPRTHCYTLATDIVFFESQRERVINLLLLDHGRYRHTAPSSLLTRGQQTHDALETAGASGRGDMKNA